MVSATGNNAVRAMLLRDMHNLHDTLLVIAPELTVTHLGENMWSLYEGEKLVADHALTGEFTFGGRTADTRAMPMSIEDARQVALIGEQRRQAASEDDLNEFPHAPGSVVGTGLACAPTV